MRYQNKRSSGVLLHINSLHGPRSIGTMGEEAYRFIDTLSDAGQSIWQMLPIHPPDSYHNPYSALTAFGGNPQVMTCDISEPPGAGAFDEWHEQNRDWIDDWALFIVIKKTHNDEPWYKWPAPLKDRDRSAMQSFQSDHEKLIDDAMREQFLFDLEWMKLRAYAFSKGITLFGDLPIFVAWDSADVWANRRLFDLDDNGHPVHVSGVPPDYFSQTGQRWGNPLYIWKKHAEDDYSWWRRRLAIELRRFDMVRIDHFRAIEQFWEIPSEQSTARKGRWVDGPGRDFLQALLQVSGPGKLVAEDLGVIPPSIITLRREFDIPGMAVLHFAFDSPERDENSHHPDNMEEDVICYPGTHDNATTVSWFEETENTDEPELLRRRKRILSLMRGGEEVQQALVRTAFESPARIAIASMQDLLGLDNSARMNTPGRTEGNWVWRMSAGQLQQVDWAWLAQLTKRTGRSR